MLYSDFIRTRMNSLNVTAEATGYPCILPKSKGKKLKDYKISGNTIQNGNPTPTHPIIPIFLGESRFINFNSEGKNKFNVVEFEENLRAGFILNNSGTEVSDSTSTYSTYKIPVVVGVPYNIYGAFQRVYLLDSNYNLVTRNVIPTTIGITNTIYTPSINGYFEFQIYNSNYNANKGQEQIEENALSNSQYESYKTPIQTIINLDGHDPLRRLGTIVDYIDYKNSRIVRRIGKLDLGSANWDLSAGTFTTGYINIKTGGNQPLVCERYTQMSYASIQPTTPYGMANSPWARMAIWINDERYATTAEFKNSVNGLYLYYPLAENSYEPIDLPEIPTVKGNCNLTAQDDEISSSLIYAKYIK